MPIALLAFVFRLLHRGFRFRDGGLGALQAGLGVLERARGLALRRSRLAHRGLGPFELGASPALLELVARRRARRCLGRRPRRGTLEGAGEADVFEGH